ncbi:pseudouridine synthase [Cereibacter sediminicola]|uniref:pseudouridine synthase n=1 Tax=Cereibacter sediminicola TaxID=2584941 RepID=UPI0016423AD9|nr:pseudouridine synthase [Cereibacter sediminicola]
MTDSTDGERIAKVLSRAGVASRRDAERMIELGRVAVNGRTIDSPALNVGPKDRITVDGQPLAPPEPARLWLYYKPEGLVTSASDEKGRDTVFDHLPEDLPRVMSVGRLDLNSEGLLLLTNDGELKRRLELPSTGWLRKYRVRVKGNPTDPDLEPLRKGITVEGERFQPMTVTLDRVQGANAWLTVGLREGKNREIRRAMSAIGLTVNRLIRISYGPFRLNELQPGMVEEVRPKVLRDQLGLDPREEEGRPPKAARPPRAAGAASGRPHPGARPAASKSLPPDEAPGGLKGASRGRNAGTAPKSAGPARRRDPLANTFDARPAAGAAKAPSGRAFGGTRPASARAAGTPAGTGPAEARGRKLSGAAPRGTSPGTGPASGGPRPGPKGAPAKAPRRTVADEGRGGPAGAGSARTGKPATSAPRKPPSEGRPRAPSRGPGGSGGPPPRGPKGRPGKG